MKAVISHIRYSSVWKSSSEEEEEEEEEVVVVVGDV